MMDPPGRQRAPILGPDPPRNRQRSGAAGRVDAADAADPTDRADPGTRTLRLRSSRDRLTAPAVVVAICPFLVAADAESRAAAPTRDHRCGAVEPPARLPMEKQERLCLTAGHLDCAAYIAATSPMAERPLVAAARPVPRTVPTVLERANPLASLSRFSTGGVRAPALPGRAAQLALAGAMVVALALVLLVRFNGGLPAGGPGGSSAPSASTILSSAPPTGGAFATPSAAPTAASPAPTTAASSSAAPTPAPTRRPSSYRVKTGDTLSSIAARFGTTAAKLMALNHITDPKSLRVGQLLKLR